MYTIRDHNASIHLKREREGHKKLINKKSGSILNALAYMILSPVLGVGAYQGELASLLLKLRDLLHWLSVWVLLSSKSI